MESKRCYGCMKQKTQTPLCEHCGYNEYIDNLSHQLPLGTILQGRYEIGKVLGQGGFGITYIGWDHARETAVAVKEFYPNGIVNREASVSQTLKVNTADSAEAFERNRKRFLQEAYVLQKLNDIPQIVHVENLFEENNTAYIVMDLIRGIDLRRYIRMMGGKLSVSKTFDILCPIMEALHRAHEAGLVHRDVSPDNIMLMPDGKAKLLDFGAAREVMVPELGHVQSTEAILKHGFAPIEQYQRNGALGPWTDVYALSATVYYCLTGQIPPDAPKRIMDGVEIPWNTIPGLSDWQAEVLRKAMEPMPRNRTRSVDEVRTALFAGPGSREEPWVEIDAGPGPDPNPGPVTDIPQIPNSGTTGQGTYTTTGQGGSGRTGQGVSGVTGQGGSTGGGGRNQNGQGVSGGRKTPWGKIAAIAAAVAVVVLGGVMLLKGGESKPAPGSRPEASQNAILSEDSCPAPTINKEIPTQVDMAAIFTGNPDETITYADGSRAEIYMTGGQETARALFDKDGQLFYRFLAGYNENGDMLYQLSFDADNVCVRADTYTYDENGNLITDAIILENGQIFETWAYTLRDDGQMETQVRRNNKNEITLTGTFEYDGDVRSAYKAVYADGSTYESTYDSEGRLASSVSYDKDGKFESAYECVYDDQGNQIRRISRREDGKVENTWESEFDAEGNRIRQITYNDMNEVETRTEFVYACGEQIGQENQSSGGYYYSWYNMCGIAGNTVRSYNDSKYSYGYDYYTAWGQTDRSIGYDVETHALSSESTYNYDADYNFLGYDYVYYSSYDGSRTEYRYDSDYRDMGSRTYDKDGNLESWEEPEYDENGNEIKSTTYNADGSIRQTYERTYDENGRETEIVSTYYYENGTRTVYVMDGNYDNQSRTDYDASGKVTDMATYEYEYDANGKKTRQYVYDENGKLDYWTEYFYDADGNYQDSQWHDA